MGLLTRIIEGIVVVAIKEEGISRFLRSNRKGTDLEATDVQISVPCRRLTAR